MIYVICLIASMLFIELWYNRFDVDLFGGYPRYPHATVKAMIYALVFLLFMMVVLVCA